MGHGVTVQGTVMSSTAADGSLSQVFSCDRLAGEIEMTDTTAGITCPVTGTNTVTYGWSNNLAISGAFDASFCGVRQAGVLIKLLPVVVP